MALQFFVGHQSWRISATLAPRSRRYAVTGFPGMTYIKTAANSTRRPNGLDKRIVATFENLSTGEEESGWIFCALLGTG